MCLPLTITTLFTALAPRVIQSFCLSVCGGCRKTPNSGGRRDLWFKNVFRTLACDDTIKNRKSVLILDCNDKVKKKVWLVFYKT